MTVCEVCKPISVDSLCLQAAGVCVCVRASRSDENSVKCLNSVFLLSSHQICVFALLLLIKVDFYFIFYFTLLQDFNIFTSKLRRCHRTTDG